MYSADEQLVSQTLAGDRDAFGVLVHKYQDMVFAYAFQKVRNEADAQDVTQEVFLRAYRNLYGLRHPHRFRSWLYAIMSNECNRWLARAAKTRQREMMLADAGDDQQSANLTQAVPTDAWTEDVEQAISALPDENRVAISMFYMGDCSLKEIAEFLGVSVNTVRGKLHRARRQLGSALSEHYGKLLKSRKLTGGFLMQMMEQFRHVPAPAMGFAWSSASVGKTVFTLITALCILIGLIGVRNDSPTYLPTGQIGLTQSMTNRMPMKVTLFEPLDFSSRWSISGVPVPTGKRPLAASNRASTEQGHNATNGAPMPHGRSVENPNAQSPAAIVENSAEKLTYSGRVVNDESEPVEGAEILYAVNWQATQLATRTATDGTFHFEIARPEPKKSGERLDILITHADYANRWRKLPLENTANIEIQLDAPGKITGRILNPSNEPISNVEVRIRFLMSGDRRSPHHEDYSMLNIFHHMPPAETDERGEFIFRNLPQSAMTMLHLQAPGFAKAERFGVPVGAEGLDIRLKHEGRIEGRLSYADTGAPVTDATVTVRGTDFSHGRGEAHVDENGVFVVKNLARGLYDLSLGVGPDGWTAISKGRILVTEGQTVSDVDLSLIRCGTITGRVTDTDTGEPIANHSVFLHDAAYPESLGKRHSAATDETGVYRIHAAPGQALVFTRAPRDYEDIGEVSRGVNVLEGETVTVDFQFAKGIELVIRILTKAGKPVAGARVTEEWTRVVPEGGKSNEQGEYTLGGFWAGQPLFLRAEHIERGLRGTAEVEFHPGVPVEIRMERYEQVEVSGRVVNKNGEPMPGVSIDLIQWDDQKGSLVGTNAAVTNSDGRYRGVRLVVGEEYIISALPYAEGYFAASTDRFIATKEVSHIADLVLLPGNTNKPVWEQGEEHQTEQTYAQEAEVRLDALMGVPAPELKVAKWLSGRSVSIGDSKGKTIALYFWDLSDSDNVLCIDVLNFIQKAYLKKGLVCIAVCPVGTDVDGAKRIIKEKSLIYPVALDHTTKIISARGETFDRYAVGWGDPVILIDRKGKVADIAYPLNLQDRVRALLAD